MDAQTVKRLSTYLQIAQEIVPWAEWSIAPFQREVRDSELQSIDAFLYGSFSDALRPTIIAVEQGNKADSFDGVLLQSSTKNFCADHFPHRDSPQHPRKSLLDTLRDVDAAWAHFISLHSQKLGKR